MDIQKFIKEFGHIANAAGGVARLRELTLQLAISGHLIERDNLETPVDISLDTASKQKKEYARRFGFEERHVYVEHEKFPFVIPEHWRWTRLGHVSVYIQRGKAPQYAENGEAFVVSQKCVQWPGFDLQQARRAFDETLGTYGRERFLCDGDLLWNSTGTGTVGRVSVFHVNGEQVVVADSHVAVVRLAAAVPRYVWCVIASPWVQARIHPRHSESFVSGSTQQVELATSTIRDLPLPYPPVEEQVRIVAKVDELMALCDRLESHQRNGRTIQIALRRKTIQAVVTSASPLELRSAWSRLAKHFGHLFAAPEDVDELSAFLVTLAARGLLAAHSGELPNLQAIKDDCSILRAQYIDKGLARRQKLVSMAESNTNYPSHWKVAAFEEVAVVMGGLTRVGTCGGSKRSCAPT